MLDKKKVYIIVSTFYNELTKELIKGANDAIMTSKDFDSIVTIIKVPGAFEIPGMVNQLLENHNPDLIVTLGIIIKGKTNHFELISNSTTAAIMNLTIQYNKPIGNGIISCFNKSQAVNRLDKGKDAAIAVTKILQM